jgi:ABC-2 type transport system permease protein
VLLRTWMIIWKEFRHIVRDVRTLGVVIMLPVIMLVLYGYAINLDVRHLKLAVYDQDRTPASRDLIGVFSRNEYFDVDRYPDSYAQVTRALDEGKVRAALVIPTQYAADLGSGRNPQVQLLIDGSDSTTATTAIGYAQAILQQYSAELSEEFFQRGGVPVGRAPGVRLVPVEARLRFWYNPGVKSTNFIVPGLIAVILSQLAALLTSMTIVRERERGTIEQLIASPVKPHELMLGKMIPYGLIALLNVVLVIVAGKLVFNVPLVGSPALVLLLSGLFLVAAMGIGLLISVVARSQQGAMVVALTATQLPSVVLSGFLFPISAMPPPVQWLTQLIPARHFLQIARAIFLKGSGISVLWHPTLVLLLYGLLLTVLSSLLFKKKV